MICKNFTKYIFNIKTSKICQYLNFVRYKSEGTKVVLLSSYNTVGISTAYLLKKSNLFTEICMQESRNVPNIEGIVADLNNINTPTTVTACVGTQSMADALQDASVVVMLEREIKKRKSDRRKHAKDKCITPFEKAAAEVNKMFLRNAGLCAKAAKMYAKICPQALFAIAVPPINSILPLMCSIALSTNHTVDLRKILGCMSLEVVKTNILWAQKNKMKQETVKIPVIGGSTANTLIPLFSQIHPPKLEKEMTEADFKNLTEQARYKTVKAPLATAASITKFVMSLRALIKGDEMKETLFIATDVFPETKYIAGTTQLGPAGVQYMLPFPKLSEYEKLLLESLPFYLKVDIKRGEDYAINYLRKRRR